MLIVISAVSLGTIISLNDNDSTPDTNANNDTNANANNDTNNNYDNDGDNSGANDANPSSYVESITPQFGGNGKRKSNRNTTRKHTKK